VAAAARAEAVLALTATVHALAHTREAAAKA